ncbi:hypothetical protein D3C84_1172090 [compost metagenome]
MSLKSTILARSAVMLIEAMATSNFLACSAGTMPSKSIAFSSHCSLASVQMARAMSGSKPVMLPSAACFENGG